MENYSNSSTQNGRLSMVNVCTKCIPFKMYTIIYLYAYENDKKILAAGKKIGTHNEMKNRILLMIFAVNICKCIVSIYATRGEKRAENDDRNYNGKCAVVWFAIHIFLAHISR